MASGSGRRRNEKLFHSIGFAPHRAATCCGTGRRSTGTRSQRGILGRALKDQRRFADAIAASREAIRLNPNDADLWINLADVLILQKLYDEGIEACQKALDLNPNTAMAHNNYAVGLEEMGHNAKADASYRKAMELDPLNPLFHSNLGWLMNKQKNYAEAARLFYSAVKLEPAYKEYQKNMDRALRKAYPITRWLTVAYILLMLLPLAMLFVLTQVGYGQALEPFLILLVIWVVYASFFSTKVESKLHERYLRRKLAELAG